MAVALLILFSIVVGVGSLALAAVAANRASRWTEERRVRNFEKTNLTLRLIPKAQVIGFYLALMLVLIAFFVWVYMEGWMRTASLVTGAVAISYVGWFSIRWRHLR